MMKNLRILFLLSATMVLTSCKPKEELTLAAPANVKATSVGINSLKFVWDKVSGATSYDYKLATSDGTVAYDGVSSGVSKEFVKLQSSTNYKFCVRAKNGSLVSDWAEAEAATRESGSGDNPNGGDNTGGDEPAPSDNYSEFKIPSHEDQSRLALAFPGAEGGGYLTTGGRGGIVYHVTTLEDYCSQRNYTTNNVAESAKQGTLRYGIEKVSGPRIIVFDVAGIIELKCPLKIENGNITIAGQSAPGDGICLKNYTLGIFADNVIVRYIRCRMGDEGRRYYNGSTKLEGASTYFEDDAMNSYQKTGNEKHNIIIDHCSLSWCVDECGSFYGNQDFTLQYCILSESLRISVHEKGNHGYGGIWGGQNASFHHNLLAHHDSRNPRFDHDYVNANAKGPIHYVNNVVYNWGGNSAYGGESKKGVSARQINMVNNYYKPGPATKSNVKTRLVGPTTKCSNCESNASSDVVPGLFYISGNYMQGSNDVTSDNWKGVFPDESSKLASLKATSYMGTHTGLTESAQKAYDRVLAQAGASLSRDRIDERICNEVRTGTATCTGSKGSTGGLIDTPADAGGYPEYKATDAQKAAIADSDGDGMPDVFEDKFGLDKNNAEDGKAKTLDKYGRYTNVEMYLHYLVRDNVAAQFN